MGPSKPSLFKLQLPQVGRDVNDYLSFFCTSTAIPETRLNTIAVAGHDKMGIIRDQPTAMIFGKPFTVTVPENSDFRVYKAIRSWYEQTVSGANTGRSQRMNYYTTYTKEMELTKLEFTSSKRRRSGDSYKEVLKIKFLKAYPVGISGIYLGANKTDAMTEYNIDFMYESYTVQ